MSATQPIIRPRSSGTARWRHRLRGYVRRIFARGDFSSLLITWGIMLVTAMALDAAEWTTGMGPLTTVSLFAVGFGFLLARSHYSELLALILSAIYSIAVVLCVNAWSQVSSGTLWGRVDTLLSQLGTWANEAFSGGQPTHDDIAFVVFLSVLFWFLGHNAAWHVFRVDRVWRVIIPTGLVLITNQFYYQGDNSLDAYLVAFVLLSLLLLVRSHIDTREYEWFVHRVNFPNYVRQAFFTAGAALALIIALVAWAAPTGEDDKSLDRVKDLLSGEAFTDMIDLWSRLFSSLEGDGIATADYYGGEDLQLSGAIKLGDQPVMVVQAPSGPRYYWRSTVYDTYDFNAGRWSHIRAVRAYTDNPGMPLNIGISQPGTRIDVQQTFLMLLRSSNLVHAAPQPVQLGLPVEAELNCVEDLQSRTCINENQPADVSIIRAREPLRSGDTYTVTSSVNVATAPILRQTGQDYPAWVMGLYLQGAYEVPASVRDLAINIVNQANAQTPFDKARAIENWLRTQISYNESIPAPPRDRDPVEWFLFEQREGYCNYYATAMVLMLRTQGIPARMAAGFAQGTWDPARSEFLVRERDAHTWVEAYFPGVGWVEFEPTADESPIDRQDTQTPDTVFPTMTPLPTLTPTPMVTATSAAPTEQSGANATPTNIAQDNIMAQTPTPTLAPTFTPPPPPDVTHVGGGTENNLMRVILLTLGVLLLVVVLIVAGFGFIIWNMEYRGLGGLNAAQRAYARMGIYASWVGLHLRQSSTPDERRRHLVDEVPDGEQPINTITRGYVQDRYAPPRREQIKAANQAAANDAWQDARRVFLRRKFAQWLGRGRKR